MLFSKTHSIALIYIHACIYWKYLMQVARTIPYMYKQHQNLIIGFFFFMKKYEIEIPTI